MSSTAEKLLRRMRQSANGFSRADLEAVYLEFGFEIRKGSKHDIAVHTRYRDLRSTLPNHRAFAQAYVRCCVELVTQALAREESGR